MKSSKKMAFVAKISCILVFVAVILFVFQRFIRDDFDLPINGITKKEVITIEQGTTENNIIQNDKQKEVVEEVKKETKEISVTDGVKHSVPLNEIIGGGPPKDGIPPIDDPKFIVIKEAEDFLNDNDLGIAVEFKNIKRFYPFKILVWHEIVNDIFDDQRVLITYCPLCLSGIVFDPLVSGERVEFGTSGKLWNSNLVMYDRKTDSLWSQVLGEAIVGDMVGVKLEVLESDQMLFGDWKNINPNGEVLSKKTGALRVYGDDPYGDYYTTPGVYFPVNEKDDRLLEKDYVLGIVVNGKAKAYLPEAVKRVGEVEEEFAGKIIIIKYDSDLEVVRIFSKDDNGKLTRINPFPNFWFSWVAIHPDTELFK